ncbi:MAG: RNA 2',3'-cyclic phosphodiesterase [Planctomycetes bacterium]|nr:RNA 2',3'-cyclic phosphodiesterase [Planctomycetota bacterium]
MRVFVAVAIDELIKDELARTIERLRRSGADVNWVVRENLHLTIKFLGWVEDEPLGRLRDTLRLEAARFSPMELEFHGLGRFPPRGTPRVVWAGCRGDLAGLAGAIDRAAASIGVPAETRSFAAHLTLGRVKSAGGARDLTNQIAACAGTVFGKQTVRGVALVKSTLTANGPIYDVVETFSLAP